MRGLGAKIAEHSRGRDKTGGGENRGDEARGSASKEARSLKARRHRSAAVAAPKKS